ncbi:MAG: DNA primase [Firmicutes bacterium ADurb.Bin182]|nr:MAG: DNA primase [Firmicutes bacterium ADurb.Bin182]
MARFPDLWMGELLEKNDIVSVISGYMQLKPKGRKFWGLCPFHSEKTPSFSVSPDKQLYYCFGCHSGGGVIHFVMEMEHLSFIDAVKLLSERAGLVMPGFIDGEKMQQEKAFKDRLYAANKEAALYYHSMLKSDRGEKARKYLSKRGLDARMITRFGIGYAPEGWNNLTGYLSPKGFTTEELLGADLALQKDGRVYDKYRDRIIFPIVGTNGKVLGFGARTMGTEQPKYINTSDTPVFSKRNNLYGLNLQKGSRIADLVIVEGYTDVISLSKAGIANVVASLGTALTEQQARLMKRFAGKVYICYDGDSAGQESTLRGLDILRKEGLTVRVIVMPEGADPDEYVAANGKDAFEALKDRALTLPEFKLERLASKFDMSTADGREAYALEACGFISTLQPVEQERYIASVSRKTGLSLETLAGQVSISAVDNKNSIGNYRNTKVKKQRETLSERAKAERTLAMCLAKDRDTAMYVLKKFPPGRFGEQAYENFSLELLSIYSEGAEADVPLLLSRLEEQDAEKVAQLFVDDEGFCDMKSIADDCIKAIERADIRSEIVKLSEKAEAPGLPETERRMLIKKIAELQKQLI